MLHDIHPRERKTITEYRLVFDDGARNGFGFPCNEDGDLLYDLNGYALKNYKECMDHPEKFVRWNTVIPEHRTFTENAYGTCECGRKVILYDQYMGACECECGRWYNLFGQELMPPSNWEWEGE